MSIILNSSWVGPKSGVIYYDYALNNEREKLTMASTRGFIAFFNRSNLYQVSTVWNSEDTAGSFYFTFEEARQELFGLFLAKKMKESL